MAQTDRANPAAVALLGWLIPGAGYFLLGQRIRALIIAPVLLGLFVFGILIGGMRVVEAPHGVTVAAILDHPWFIGQVLIGPVSIGTAVTAGHLDEDAVSTSRSSEIGTLYTAIAGMLNLLAMIDAMHKSVVGPEGGQESTA